jgi:hypothetical protein
MSCSRLGRRSFVGILAHNYCLNCDNGNGSKFVLVLVGAMGSDRQSVGSLSQKTLQQPKSRPLELFEIAGVCRYLLLFQQLEGKDSGE